MHLINMPVIGALGSLAPHSTMNMQPSKQESSEINMENVTEIILDEMQHQGGWLKIIHGALRVARKGERPCPRDINNGWCETWAWAAEARYGGKVITLEDFKTMRNVRHYVLRLKRRYYDSMHPGGARTLKEIEKGLRIVDG